MQLAKEDFGRAVVQAVSRRFPRGGPGRLMWDLW